MNIWILYTLFPILFLSHLHFKTYTQSIINKIINHTTPLQDPLRSITTYQESIVNLTSILSHFSASPLDPLSQPLFWIWMDLNTSCDVLLLIVVSVVFIFILFIIVWWLMMVAEQTNYSNVDTSHTNPLQLQSIAYTTTIIKTEKQWTCASPTLPCSSVHRHNEAWPTQ